MQLHPASDGALSHTVPTSAAEQLLNEQHRPCTTQTNKCILWVALRTVCSGRFWCGSGASRSSLTIDRACRRRHRHPRCGCNMLSRDSAMHCHARSLASLWTWQQPRRCLLRARVSWEMVAPTAAGTHRPAGTAALADGVCVLGAGVSGVPDSRWCGFQQQVRGHHDERGR
ncbi:hypothetical protein BU14_0014s0128 [Porphyra umbilicalis]|uniref:Uncharacterized protein n=2 Tax=Porphyra umbilicalis TaxID=2786 RepID=A0A1X6PL97_PORUM|nr:hypothetical protein BU14_0014s0128 [Porphyra umbilicalis]|eukprot:OSX81580.1 hypothetical protein BU14_0014s0128 [Porphyra umbilicalis]